MAPHDVSAATAMTDHWRNIVAVNLAAQRRLVDSWLEPTKDDVDPDITVSQPQIRNVQEEHASIEDDLTTLARSQRAGLGSGEAKIRTSGVVSSQVQAVEKDELDVLRRRLRLPRARGRDPQGEIRGSKWPKAQPVSSEDSESEGRASTVRPRGSRAGSNTRATQDTAPTQQAGFTAEQVDASLLAQPPAKRKAHSYLDQILEEKKAKKTKVRAKKQHNVACGVVDRERLTVRAGSATDQDPRMPRVVGHDDSGMAIQEKPPHEESATQPLSSRDVPGDSAGQERSDTAGNDLSVDPVLQQLETEAARRRRKNKDKKIKFKQKQQQRRAHDALVV